MTYTTTHLGISNLLIFNFLSKSRKKYLIDHPKKYLILSLGALIPDFDIIMGYHRSVSHSLFIPLSILFLLSFVRNEDRAFDLKYICYTWLSHMLFDLSFGPMMLFWPLDDRLYDLNFSLKLNLLGNFLLPVTIVGFNTSLTPVNPEIGTSVFFLNWTAEQRVTYFGSEYYALTIPSIFLHIVIFGYYVFKIIMPVLILFYSQYIDDTRLRTQISKNRQVKYFQSIHKIRLFSLLIMLTTSLYVGPLLGPDAQQTALYKETLWSLTNNFRLIGLRSFSGIQGGDIEVNIHMDNPSINLTLFAAEVTKNVGNAFIEAVEGNDILINDSFTQQDYYERYTHDLQNYSFAAKSTFLDASWQFHGSKELNIIFGIQNWTTEESFIEQMILDVAWSYDRDSQYTAGIFGVYFFAFSIMLVCLHPIFKKEQ